MLSQQKIKDLCSPISLTGIYAVFWCLLWIDAHVWFWLNRWLAAIGFISVLPVFFFWVSRHRKSSLLIRRGVLSAFYLPVWQLAVHLPLLNFSYALSITISQIGTVGAFFLGLGWTAWGIDQETKRISTNSNYSHSWDPRRLSAWYFGKKNHQLRQSLLTLVSYTILFSIAAFILTRLSGCSIYESPLGGGESIQLKQVVKIQKVINKKFVINPYSSVLFNPPPIDDVKLEVLEVTEHLYQIGQGKGDSAGFSSGTTYEEKFVSFA